MKLQTVELYFLPVTLRVPLKFGAQVLENVTCARAKVTLEAEDGSLAVGKRRFRFPGCGRQRSATPSVNPCS